MNILKDKFSERQVIGLSGHKSEGTVKQYARKLSAKTKKEMCGTLADNILPKQPQTTQKFQFKSIKPVEALGKLPKREEPAPEVNSLAPAPNLPQNVNYEYETFPINEEPSDDVLINFLRQFDAPDEHNSVQANQENIQPVNVPVPQQRQNPIVPLHELQPANPTPPQQIANNTMNIQQNVQNVNPNQRMPVLYFPGSNVMINYNFAK